MGTYDDIIELPYHKSHKRTHMPARDRAAQFAPFAALSGYGEAVDETARLTDERIELDQSVREEIGEELRLIGRRPEAETRVAMTYFVPDLHKSGGSYVIEECMVSRVDEYLQTVVLSDGRIIPMEDIYMIKMR